MDTTGLEVEFALLAAPLPGEAPAGVDPRLDFSPQSLYSRLRDARAEAREIERRIDHDPEADASVPAQWRMVRDLAAKALTEQTKDLEIAAWLTEALVRFGGVTGLAVGAALIADLCATLWDSDLLPLPDEDGIATRVAPVAGLNGQSGDGTLMQPLRKIVLFNRLDGSPVTFWQYKQSEELEGIADSDRRKQRLNANVALLEDLAVAARQTGSEHFAALRSDVQAALSAWTRMAEELDTLAGQDAPPTRRVRELLEAIVEIANRYAPPEPETGVEAAPADATPDAGATAGGVPGLQVPKTASREDMLRELGRIAEYFRRTEPHSPLAYTLEEAVRRGRLTWPELLQEVVPDDGTRSSILLMLGIRPPAAPAKED